MRIFHSVCGLVAVLSVAACKDPLLVENENQPERARALSRPADVETFIANSFNSVHDATLGTNGGLQPGMLVMGLESYSGNANFDMNVRGGIPRGFVDNSRGNSGEGLHERDWRVLHRAARSAAIGLARINAGVSFGVPTRDQRNKAFAWFVMGLGLGNLALVYDSVTQIKWDDPAEQSDFPLLSYDAAMTLALGYLDSAVATAEATPGGFPLPAAWLNTTSFSTNGEVSKDDFVRVAKSYMARFRAGVARTPTERQAVDWDKVIADAQAGIRTDYRISMNPSAGWSMGLVQMWLYQSWHQMWSYMIGMADSSGAYDAWLAAPLSGKVPFIIQTTDRRFPAGADRPTQNANSPAVPPATLYYRNRPAGQDVVTANTLANSYYDFYRFQAFHDAQRIGPYPVMTRAEINLLLAEGAIRKGQWALAAQYIDSSRVRSNLPSVAGITDLTTPVRGGTAASPAPGAPSCVPRVPAAPNFTSTVCGNIFEALKWEYRMETAFTGYAMWYLAGRGWGDLPQGTPIHHPVPYQELDVRAQSLYNLGGVGLPGGAARGAYGL